MSAEVLRMRDQANLKRWQQWGPYLADRQWATVREDYSQEGDAWNYLSHEIARRRAYRWGEEGIGGFSDQEQQLCLALVVWNHKDPILKENFFGLTSPQGNHGEDVKEYYYYLDATPSHSYLKMLYKYPQHEFPYRNLVETNRVRGKTDPEFELMDTGVFAEQRYFDIFIEYARPRPDEIFMQITAINRGPEPSKLTLLPQLWFRNTWSWKSKGDTPMPVIRALGKDAAVAWCEQLGDRYFYADVGTHGASAMFCENETNTEFLYGVQKQNRFFKDGFHEAVVHGRERALNQANRGTKLAMRYELCLEPNAEAKVLLKLTDSEEIEPFNLTYDPIARARHEADEYYAFLQQDIPDFENKRVQRQALAGLIWSKQFYYFNIREWLSGDPEHPAPPEERKQGRNSDWEHLHNYDVISMPDTFEYPWYAAWDLAFHCIPFALLDPGFAKEQLLLMTKGRYMHPNGQLPAYEWNFSEVNPPVHAWAAWRVFQIDRKQRGDRGDIAFIEQIFHKLLINFTWWVNKKDVEGRNLFKGGFLGLDNIGIFDRSKTLSGQALLHQSDGTAWMAMYSLNMMRIALELAINNPVYEDVASKFFEHFLLIAKAMSNMGGEGIGLWNEEDKFYYDVLHLEGGECYPLRLRSMVGLIPLFAVETLEPELLERVPNFSRRMEWFLCHRPDLACLVSRWHEPGRGERRLFSLLRGHRMKCLFRRMLDPSQFLSAYGIRALSKEYEQNPFEFQLGGVDYLVRYQSAESDSYMFGGNSNWRGPIWFPVNYLIIESMQKFHHYYGDEFRIECPTGSGNYTSILEASEVLAKRLISIFLPDKDGLRPVYRHCPSLLKDQHFKDHLMYFEYFDGDNGRGVGASHQTGWTALVAKLIHPRKPAKACFQGVQDRPHWCEINDPL